MAPIFINDTKRNFKTGRITGSRMDQERLLGQAYFLKNNFNTLNFYAEKLF